MIKYLPAVWSIARNDNTLLLPKNAEIRRYKTHHIGIKRIPDAHAMHSSNPRTEMTSSLLSGCISARWVDSHARAGSSKRNLALPVCDPAYVELFRLEQLLPINHLASLVYSSPLIDNWHAPKRPLEKGSAHVTKSRDKKMTYKVRVYFNVPGLRDEMSDL
ncbi:hypothetical protein BDV39DRAFT_187620 [Aspergillus sergii]|uniref:Uncharacterized protein n=1 Tax=Aspergillus sergii TaxID=1034303 RepID=A0A5N6WI93_9EURO|nr:hypothetical protein BDV39DRAFT_187620 [Aspergillus sergii]